MFEPRQTHSMQEFSMIPTLSVVIPTKNEAKYLPAVLEALKKQTLQPNQIIVADAWSTDETRNIAQSFGAMVVDGGLPSIGRNRGAAVATGDLIFFFDADIIIRDDQFLEHAVAEFTEKNFGIATCNLGVVDGNAFDVFAHNFYNVYVRALLRLHPHAPGFCILVKRSIHEAIHGFDETVLFCEDHDYAGRAAKIGKFGLMKSVKLWVTTRRQQRDGRVSMTLKYILAEFHIMFLGPIRHNRFQYGFGYDEHKNES